MPSEFSKDDYIIAKTAFGECLASLGKATDCIRVFEEVKRDIFKEVIFDNWLLLVNVCNQLGNQYMRRGEQNKALENYEHSLYII